MFEKLKYWFWKAEMRNRMKSHPALPFMWRVRELTVYDPAFKEGGFDAVIAEHDKHLSHVKEQVKA